MTGTIVVMKITPTTTAEDVWAYHLAEKRKVLEPLKLHFATVVDEAKDARAEADRGRTALAVAEARIAELEAEIRDLQREVDRLRHYRDVVEAALADEAH